MERVFTLPDDIEIAKVQSTEASNEIEGTWKQFVNMAVAEGFHFGELPVESWAFGYVIAVHSDGDIGHLPLFVWCQSFSSDDENYPRKVDYRHFIDIIDVFQRKGVTLVSSKENIDTNTPQGRFVLSIFAALSELEREQTLQRQREGIAIAKAQGKYKGRQPISVDWENFAQLYEQWKSGRITAVEFRKRMKLNKNTFYRRVREYESKL